MNGVELPFDGIWDTIAAIAEIGIIFVATASFLIVVTPERANSKFLAVLQKMSKILEFIAMNPRRGRNKQQSFSNICPAQRSVMRANGAEHSKCVSEENHTGQHNWKVVGFTSAGKCEECWNPKDRCDCASYENWSKGHPVPNRRAAVEATKRRLEKK